jgi:hypothetical protein
LANLNNSNPAIFNSTNQQEAYGYIYSQNGSTTAFRSDGPNFINLNEGGTALIPGPATFNGWTAVGIWHTHPFSTTNPTGIDLNTGTHFSPSDENLTNSTGLTMYVGVTDTTSSPIDTNPQTRWYSYTGGTTDTLMGNVGNGGC